MAAPFTQDQRDEIERRLAFGQTFRVIAEEMGVSLSGIARCSSRWRKANGIKPGGAEKALTPDQVHELRLMVEKSTTAATISRHFGVCLGTIQKYVTAHSKAAALAGRDIPNVTRLSVGQIAEIERMAAESVSVPEIARRMNVSEGAVYNRVRIYRMSVGLPVAARSPFSKAKYETVTKAVFERLWQGETHKNIAAGVGISPTSVHRYDKLYRTLYGVDSLPTDRRRQRLTDEDRAARAADRVSRAEQRQGVAAERVRRREREARQRARELLMISSQEQSSRQDALYARIAGQVPRWITGATRDDIISDAYLKAMEHAL